MISDTNNLIREIITILFMEFPDTNQTKKQRGAIESYLIKLTLSEKEGISTISNKLRYIFSTPEKMSEESTIVSHIPATNYLAYKLLIGK